MSIDEPQRMLYTMRFFVDTNCVNARQSMPAMNRLEAWAESEIIELLTAETAQNEMASGNNAKRKQKAYNFIYAEAAITTNEERQTKDKIQKILAPNGIKSQNEANDIDIVFTSQKYVASLITNDGGSKSQPGGILGNRNALASIGAKVLTPEEAEEKVKEAILERDNFAKQWASYTNKPLPIWVGKD